MRACILLAVMLASAQCVSAFAEVKQDSTRMVGDLTIVVQGLCNDDGTVQIGLFNSEETWESGQHKFNGAKIGIKDGKAVWVVKDVPYGYYAIKFFHDEDNNGELDTNFLGLPAEEYGFSNNARGLFGPPKYEKAKFLFDDKHDEMRITID